MKVTEKPVKLLLPSSQKAEARKKRASARIMLWRLRNPERRREQLKKQQNEIHEWLNLYKLDKGCIDCGYKGHHVALELDHVRGEKTPMKVVEKPVNIKLPASKTARGVGVHASSIIRCIATEAWILRPEWAEELSLVDVREITDPVAILRMAIGLAFEEWYIPNILGPEGVIDHPGEIHVDGIYMNPDGESLSSIIVSTRKIGESVKKRIVNYPVLHEIKATYKSINTVGDMTGKSEWMWRTQLMAYCYAKKTHLAEMHILFLCGDYTYPIKPQIKRFKLEFTQEELDHNWALLTEYKEYHQGLESRK